MEEAVQARRQWAPRTCPSPQDKKPSAAPQMGSCVVDLGWPAFPNKAVLAAVF